MVLAARRRWRKRGISTLCVDQPGTGEALRLHGLPATHRASAGRRNGSTGWRRSDDVDPKRLGMTGISLGGYYAPRAVAFEPRFASRRGLGRQPQLGRSPAEAPAPRGREPGPALLGARHVGVRRQRTWTTSSPRRRDMTLDGVIDRIKVPFLVTHGEQDRQIGARLRPSELRPAGQFADSAS